MGRDVEALARRIEIAAEQAGVASGDDYIFGRIAAGESPRLIMQDFGVSRTWFYNWLDRDEHGAERKQRLADARREAAPALIERGRDKLEDLDSRGVYTSQEVSLTNSLANYYKAMAEMYDPERFGRRNTPVNVNLSIENLYLDALRQAGGAVALPVEQPTKLLEAEVVSDAE